MNFMRGVTSSTITSSPISIKNTVKETTSQINNNNNPIQEYLAELSKKYDNLSIQVGNFKPNDIGQMISKNPVGNHLWISQDFLEQMEKDPEAFEKGKQLIEQSIQEMLQPTQQGIVGTGTLLTQNKKNSWEVKLPTPQDLAEQELQAAKKMYDKLEQAKKQNDKYQKQLRAKKVASLMNSASQIYSRLARSNGTQQVRGVISSASAKLNQARSAMNKADSQERRQLQMLSQQLQTAIGRSRNKIKQLNTEQYLENREKQARKQQELKEATQIKHILKRKKSARSSREYGYMQQAGIESYLEQERVRKALLAQQQFPFSNMGSGSDFTTPDTPTTLPSNGGSISFSAGGFQAQITTSAVVW